jgi:hypothetical protein
MQSKFICLSMLFHGLLGCDYGCETVIFICFFQNLYINLHEGRLRGTLFLYFKEIIFLFKFIFVMFSNNFIIIKKIKKNYFNILKKNILKKLPTISRYMSLIQ